MTDGEALLAAILANPADDTARLVYADWLQEQGEEERAKFIRVQCELESYPMCENVRTRNYDARDGISSEWQRCFDLENRERELFRENLCWSGWMGSPARRDVLHVRNLDNLGTLVGCVFSRGFVSEIRLPLAAWEQHAASIWSRHPVQRVALTDREPRNAEAQFWWHDQRFISVRGYESGTDPDDLPAELIQAMYQLDLGSGTERYRFFDTPEAALNALSDAACLVGRNRARKAREAIAA